MRTVLGYGVLGLFLIIIGLLVFLTLWPRPTDTTEPWVFGNDGAELNYCAPVELDGQGPAADEIPKAYTPDCGFSQMPMPISVSYTHLTLPTISDV